MFGIARFGLITTSTKPRKNLKKRHFSDNFYNSLKTTAQTSWINACGINAAAKLGV